MGGNRCRDGLTHGASDTGVLVLRWPHRTAGAGGGGNLNPAPSPLGFPTSSVLKHHTRQAAALTKGYGGASPRDATI